MTKEEKINLIADILAFVFILALFKLPLLIVGALSLPFVIARLLHIGF